MCSVAHAFLTVKCGVGFTTEGTESSRCWALGGRIDHRGRGREDFRGLIYSVNL